MLLLLVLLPLLSKIRYSYIEFFFSLRQSLAGSADCRAKKKGEVTSEGNMQKRHVNQKARGMSVSFMAAIYHERFEAKHKASRSETTCTHTHYILWRCRGPWWRFQEWLMPGRGRRAYKERRLAEQQSGLLATRCALASRYLPLSLPFARLLTRFIVR